MVHQSNREGRFLQSVTKRMITLLHKGGTRYLLTKLETNHSNKLELENLHEGFTTEATTSTFRGHQL